MSDLVLGRELAEKIASKLASGSAFAQLESDFMALLTELKGDDTTERNPVVFEKTISIKLMMRREDNAIIGDHHLEVLEESAFDQAVTKIAEGYTEGDLSDNIHMGEEEDGDGIAYRGYWSISSH